MPKYEYIRLLVDFGDLSELNSLGSTGWHVVAVAPHHYHSWVLLERTIETPIAEVKP